MKRKLLWFVCLCLFLGVWACSSGKTPENEGSEFRVTVPGTVPTLTFGESNPGERYTKSFLLYNEGKFPLTVTEIVVRGPGRDFFKVSSPALPFGLLPGKGAGKTIKVTFTPGKDPDFHEAEIGFGAPSANNVREDGFFYVRTEAKRGKPLPVFDCQKKLAFGAVELGKEKLLSCRVTNRGGFAMRILQVDFVPESGDPLAFVWKKPLSFPVTVTNTNTAGIELSVMFRPKTFTTKVMRGRFVLSTDIPGESDKTRHAITVEGRVPDPSLIVVPETKTCANDVDCGTLGKGWVCRRAPGERKQRCLRPSREMPRLPFGNAVPGTLAQASIQFYVLGSRAVTIKGVRFASTHPGFSLANPPAWPVVLQPGKALRFLVRFDARLAKAGLGTMSLDTDMTGREVVDVALGTPAPSCALRAKPAKVSFTQDIAQNVVLTNMGSVDCTLLGFALKDPDAAFSIQKQPAAGIKLRPGQETFVSIQPLAHDAASVSGALEVRSNDPNRPTLVVSLTSQLERSKACIPSLSVKALDFGSIAPGKIKVLSFVIRNEGWGACNFTRGEITNASPGDIFAWGQVPIFPISLRKDKVLTLRVLFSPKIKGIAYEGRMTLSGPKSVRLRLKGVGARSCLVALYSIPKQKEAKVGCASTAHTLTLVHSGEIGCPNTVKVTGFQCTKGSCGKSAIFRWNQSFPLSVTARELKEIAINYYPTKEGTDIATLQVATDVSGQAEISVDLSGQGLKSDSVKELQVQPRLPKADLLFLIQSGSFYTPLFRSLSNEFASLTAWKADYQIAVLRATTTPGGPGFVGKPGCINGTTIVPTTANPSNALNSNFNTSTYADRKGLEALRLAMLPPRLGDPQCSKGFFRPDASLHVVVVSPNDDYSQGTVRSYVDFLKQRAKSTGHPVLFSMISGAKVGTCQTTTPRMFVKQAPRWLEMTKELGGFAESICSVNWKSTASRISKLSFGPRTYFTLQRPARGDTISVKVGTQTVPESSTKGWTFDATSNQIRFAPSAVPNGGATVEIQYKARCLP